MRLRRTKHFLSLATKANIFGVKIIESWKWRGIAWIKNNTETQSTAHEKKNKMKKKWKETKKQRVKRKQKN